MSKIILLCGIFLKELFYKKVLLISFFIGLCFIILSFLLGPLSFNEESRLAVNFSLAGSQISLIFLSVLVGADFLRSDIETGAIHSLLSRPVSRVQYFVAKVMSFGVCLIFMILLMWFIFRFISKIVGLGAVDGTLLPFLGFYLEALILFSSAMAFSLFSSSLFSIGLSFAIFLSGHWVEVFKALAEKSEVEFVKVFSLVFSKVLPNLESLNWKSHLTYEEWMPWEFYFKSSLYGVSWVLLMILFGVFIFSKKDLA